MRLKSAEIGYSLPKNVCKKIASSGIRFYVSGNNLLTFSSFKLWDPELSWNSFPLQRTFNIGLQFHF